MKSIILAGLMVVLSSGVLFAAETPVAEVTVNPEAVTEKAVLQETVEQEASAQETAQKTKDIATTPQQKKGGLSASEMIEQMGGGEEIIRSQFGTQGMRTTSVVQTRFFPKKYRHQFTFLMGAGVHGEAYLETQEMGGKYSFYINNWLGIGGTYIKRFRQFNQNYYNLVKAEAVSPEMIPPTESYGGDLLFTPAYAKVNLFDWTIVRLEVYLEAGYHIYKTDFDKTGTFHSAGGIRVLPTRNVSFAVGLNNYLFKEKKMNGKKWRDVMSVNASISYWLGGSSI